MNYARVFVTFCWLMNDSDDRDDDCCSPHLSVPASPRSVSRPSSPRPALSVPGSPRTRSKSPAASKNSLHPTPASSPGPKRPTSLLTVSGTAPASRNRTPSPRTPSRTPRTSPSPSLRSSPAPARKVSARGLSPRWEQSHAWLKWRSAQHPSLCYHDKYAFKSRLMGSFIVHHNIWHVTFFLRDKECDKKGG